jgi:hypothetical protein
MALTAWQRGKHRVRTSDKNKGRFAAAFVVWYHLLIAVLDDRFVRLVMLFLDDGGLVTRFLFLDDRGV